MEKTLTNNIAVGDVIKVEKQGTTIKIYYNELLKHTFNNVPNKDYFIDFCGHIVNNLNLDLLTSFDYGIFPNETISHLCHDNNFSGGINLSNIKGGVPPYTYSWSNGSTSNQLGVNEIGNYAVTVTDSKNNSVKKTFAVNYDVIWQNKENISANQNILNSTGGDYWKSGMSSINVLQAGKDGYFEFKPKSINQYYMIGFSTNDESKHFKTIEYALYIAKNSILVYKSGSNQGKIGNFVIGDKLTVKKEGETILIEKNGSPIYKTECNPEVSYMIDASIRQSIQLDLDITASFGYPQSTPVAHYVRLSDKKSSGRISSNGNILKVIIPNTTKDLLKSCKYEIYASDRTVASSGDFENHITDRGVELRLSSLNLNDSYTLVVMKNKNDKYYLRFKYTN